MDIQKIKTERQKWMQWKNIKPLRDALDTIDDVKCSVKFGDIIEIDGDFDDAKIYKIAKMMMPWRKGPFKIGNTFIDSEWRSDVKYNLLKEFFNLKDKKVADVGCNNGYYMFRMLEENPKLLVGFDPSALYKTQFDFLNHFIKSEIVYELLGVEHLEYYSEKFDTIFCLGVLYHRSDPVSMLKSLYRSLKNKGEVILDTFYINGSDEMVLSPKSSYSKIPNVYFVPTITALQNWVFRAKFDKFEILKTKITNSNEQRKTEWIEGESLNDFLDPNDSSKTVEGYDAPQRVYVKLLKDK